jgi:hypothetical protein
VDKVGNAAKTLRSNLSLLADQYGRLTGATPEQISARFYGNRIFLKEFRSGNKTISIDKFDAMVAAFRKAWPKKAPFPMLRSVVFDKF